MKVVYYKTKDNKSPFKDWVITLSSIIERRVYQRLSRIEEGNLGDYKPLKGELYELRFFFDAGIRVYFTKQNNTIILLLCGGNKKTQKKDILTAREFIKQIKGV